MNFSFIAWLRVLSLLFIPIGLLLLLVSMIGGIQRGFEMTPFGAIILVFLGLLGNVVCGIAEK